MFEFIFGTSGVGKTQYCLTDICNHLKKSPTGNPLLLLLPEHITFKLEKRLALLMQEEGGFSRAFVFGFRRLCHKILSQLESNDKIHLTEIGKIILLSYIIDLHKKDLTILSRAAKQHNFTFSFANIINEFKLYGINSNLLNEIANEVPETQFSYKLKDISLLLKAFQENIEPKFNDNSDLLILATQLLKNSDWLNDVEIWIDGFIFFNPRELALLEVLFKKAKFVHITFCLDKPNNKENNLETSLFYRTYKTYKEIKEICKKFNQPIKNTILTNPYRFLSPSIKIINDNLFKFPLPKKPIKLTDNSLHITENANQRLEVIDVACKIISLCHQNNLKYSDIGVIIRDLKYQSLLENIFDTFNIPFFSDHKRPFIHHPLAELIRSSLEAIQNWQYDALMRCFKTDFFLASRDEIDLLENYVLKFGIKGKKKWLLEKWDFIMYSNQELSDEEKLYLDKINDIHNKIISPLKKFHLSMTKACDAKDMTIALYQYLIDLNVPEKLSLWQKEAENEGRLEDASEHRQIWEDVLDLLEQIVQTCGSLQFTLKNYIAIIEDGIQSLKISMIPPGFDYVTIAQLDQNSLENKDAIFILGVNEGSIPQKITNDGLLNESDRLYLSSLGLKLLYNPATDNFSEAFTLYRAFTLPRKYLFISYALSSGDNNSINRSCLIDRLEQLFIFDTNVFETNFLEENHPYSIIKHIVNSNLALTQLINALRHYREKNEFLPFWQDVYNFLLTNTDKLSLDNIDINGLFFNPSTNLLSKDIAEKMYLHKKTLSGSVTRFETFNACNFKHFIRYGLNLKERSVFSFSKLDLGNFLHNAIYNFSRLLLENHLDWKNLSSEEKQKFCDEAINLVIKNLPNDILFSSGQYRHLLKRISSSTQKLINRMSDFAKHSEFKTIAVEKDFGTNNNCPIKYQLNNNLSLRINGKIDRIDSDGKHLLILDYKSSEKSSLSLAEIYYGLKLQLLTYLLAALKSSKEFNILDPIPAGILYCFLFHHSTLSFNKPVNEETVRKELLKAMRMPGWLLEDLEVIKKIDSSSIFIKPTFTKQGTLSKNSFDSVKSLEEFNALIKYTNHQLKETGQKIIDGNININPYKSSSLSACTFCLYHSICRFETCIEGFDYNSINLDLNSEEKKLLMEKIINLFKR